MPVGIDSCLPVIFNNYNNFMKIYSAIVILIIFCSGLYAQGGWTREKGQYFVKTDISHLSSDSYYNPLGTNLKTTVFSQTSVNFYGEYGLKDRLTLITSMPLLRRNAFETSEPVYGIGDLKLELKYRLLKSFPLAISVAPEIPTGRSNAFASNKSDPTDKINLPTGDGEFNVWTTLAASGSVGKVYSSIYGSYNYRTKYKGLSFVDLYQIGFEVGVNPIKDLWFNTKVRAQFSTGESKHPDLGFVRGDGTTYTLISAEAFYKFSSKWGLSATYLTGGDFIAPFKNIYIAPYFSIGLTYEN